MLDAIVALCLAFGQNWAPLPASALLGPPRLAAFAEADAAGGSLLELSDEELRARVERDPSSVGSLSIGRPGAGRLLNAVELLPDPRWAIPPSALSWGTRETIAAIEAAVDTVHQLFPDTPPIFIGDISSPDGGRLKRHETHQAGRDVDFGFYYLPGQEHWFSAGTPRNLDVARNWALVRALVVCTDVERILLDTRIQRILYRYALSVGEDREWLDRVFQVGRGARDAIVRHVTGHRTHYHVRFFNPVAQEMGRRAHPYLVELGLVPPPVYTIGHVVRRGQTLGHLARRYGVSASAIREANGLNGNHLRAGRTYRIPVRTPAPPAEPLVLPPRLLPPDTPATLASFEWPTASGASATTAGER